MFSIILYNNASDNAVVSKMITQIAELTGTLRNETNIMRPVILVASEAPPICNYASIPAFGRYYYVTDIRCVRNGAYELHLSVDVLMSHNLSNVWGVLTDTQSTEKNNYLPSRGFVTTAKSKTDIAAFPYGLNDEGAYILITAGGVVS